MVYSYRSDDDDPNHLLNALKHWKTVVNTANCRVLFFFSTLIWKPTKLKKAGDTQMDEKHQDLLASW